MQKRVQKLSTDAGAAFFIARTLREASHTVKVYEPYVCRAAAVYEKRGARYAEASNAAARSGACTTEGEAVQGGA